MPQNPVSVTLIRRHCHQAAFMEDLLRGETPRADGDGDGGGGESRWLLDRAPAGAFDRVRTASHINPLMVRAICRGERDPHAGSQLD